MENKTKNKKRIYIELILSFTIIVIGFILMLLTGNVLSGGIFTGESLIGIVMTILTMTVMITGILFCHLILLKHGII